MQDVSSTANFILYGTSACHLCELAEDMIAALRAAGCEVSVAKVDISDSDELMLSYGVRIPVLRHPNGRELGWPFSAEQLLVFCAVS